MASVILGRKVGMTRLYDDDGKNIPVTVIQAGPCFVSQIKTAESDGYEAVQIAFEDVKGRNSTFQMIGHDLPLALGQVRAGRVVTRDAGIDVASEHRLLVAIVDGHRSDGICGVGNSSAGSTRAAGTV